MVHARSKVGLVLELTAVVQKAASVLASEGALEARVGGQQAASAGGVEWLDGLSVAQVDVLKQISGAFKTKASVVQWESVVQELAGTPQSDVGQGGTVASANVSAASRRMLRVQQCGSAPVEEVEQAAKAAAWLAVRRVADDQFVALEGTASLRPREGFLFPAAPVVLANPLLQRMLRELNAPDGCEWASKLTSFFSRAQVKCGSQLSAKGDPWGLVTWVLAGRVLPDFLGRLVDYELLWEEVVRDTAQFLSSDESDKRNIAARGIRWIWEAIYVIRAIRMVISPHAEVSVGSPLSGATAFAPILHRTLVWTLRETSGSLDLRDAWRDVVSKAKGLERTTLATLVDGQAVDWSAMRFVCSHCNGQGHDWMPKVYAGKRAGEALAAPVLKVQATQQKKKPVAKAEVAKGKAALGF